MAATRNIMMRASRTLTSRALQTSTRSSAAFAPLRASLQPQFAANRAAALAFSRSYSSETPVTPPDYLDEGELRVFNLLKEGLQPISLEVRGCTLEHQTEMKKSVLSCLEV